MNILKDFVKLLGDDALQRLLDQYQWEHDNTPEDHTKKLTVIKEELHQRSTEMKFFKKNASNVDGMYDLIVMLCKHNDISQININQKFENNFVTSISISAKDLDFMIDSLTKIRDNI